MLSSRGVSRLDCGQVQSWVRNSLKAQLAAGIASELPPLGASPSVVRHAVPVPARGGRPRAANSPRLSHGCPPAHGAKSGTSARLSMHGLCQRMSQSRKRYLRRLVDIRDTKTSRNSLLAAIRRWFATPRSGIPAGSRPSRKDGLVEETAAPTTLALCETCLRSSYCRWRMARRRPRTTRPARAPLSRHSPVHEPQPAERSALW